ncbi:MAG: ABC transporter ATP-binding protein [Blastocatellia bacterium]
MLQPLSLDHALQAHDAHPPACGLRQIAPSIELRSISKRFVKSKGFRSLLPFGSKAYVTALNNISLCCNQGEILGVLGPNGAGKTTLTKLIINLILPDSGEIWVGGERLTAHHHEMRRKIGYVNCDERSFFWRLTGRQNLHFFLSLAGGGTDRNALQLAEYFGLSKKLDAPFGTYSTGMRKKLSIIRGLMNGPDIILFDEATNGLDPLSTMNLKQLLKTELSDKTILWTTHRLEEIDELCDRVMVINEGKLLFLGPIDELKECYRLRPARLTITLRGDTTRIAKRVRALYRPERETLRDSRYSFSLADEGQFAAMPLHLLLNETRAELISFEKDDVSLGEIYLSLVKH